MKGKESILMPTQYRRTEIGKPDQERARSTAREQKSESLQNSINLRAAEKESAREALSQRRGSVPRDAESLYSRQKGSDGGKEAAAAATASAARRRLSLGTGPRPQQRSTADNIRKSRDGSQPIVSAGAALAGKEVGSSSKTLTTQGFSASANAVKGRRAEINIGIRGRLQEAAEHGGRSRGGSLQTERPLRPVRDLTTATGPAQGVAMPATQNPCEVEASAPSMDTARYNGSDSSSDLGEIAQDADSNGLEWHQMSSGNCCNLNRSGSGNSNHGGSVAGSSGPLHSLHSKVNEMNLWPQQAVSIDKEDMDENYDDGMSSNNTRSGYSHEHSAQASTSGIRGDQRQSQLDLSAVRGHGSRGQSALVGLSNEGNTCYLNSCLQCLIHTLPLASAVLGPFPDLVQRPINRSSSFSRRASSSSSQNHDGEYASPAEMLAYAFRQLVKDCWNKAPYGVISPTSFIHCLTALAPQFAGHHQHDAQEVMRAILDGLHDAVNRVKKVSPYRDLYVEEKPEAELAELTWKYHKSCHDSVIQDIFCGQLQSTIECSVCHHKSHCFDPFMDLSLPLPKRETRNYQSRGRVTLQDCLAAFVAPELLDGSNKWFCSSCKTSQASTKQLNIYRLPPVLVFHIKRFCKGSSYSYTKDDTSVSYPIEGLDLTEILGSRSSIWTNDQATYDLYGVCNHSGSLGFGHYTAMCKNVDNDSWCHFNDSCVSPITEASVQSSAAYILFYQQRKSMLS